MHANYLLCTKYWCITKYRIVMGRYCLILCSVLWIFNGKEPFLYHSRNREPFCVMNVVKTCYYRGYGKLRIRKENVWIKTCVLYFHSCVLPSALVGPPHTVTSSGYTGIFTQCSRLFASVYGTNFGMNAGFPLLTYSAWNVKWERTAYNIRTC